MPSGKRMTHDEFVTGYYSKFPHFVGEYEIIGVYTKNSERLDVRHTLCGHVWSPTANNLMKGNQCPECHGHASRKKNGRNSFMASLKEKPEFSLLTSYTTCHEKVKLRHTCGHVFSISPVNFRHNHGCPKCNGGVAIEHELFVSKLKEKLPHFASGEYEITGRYIGSNSKISVTHTKCGTTFDQIAYNTLGGCKCPRCSGVGTSSFEIEIVDFLKSLGLPNSDIIQSDRKILGGRELDIFIPSKRLAIEFNGLFWHSETNNPDKRYHLRKTEECLKKDIQLIHIFENEWIEKRKILESKLRVMTGKTLRRIYARDCSIRVLEPSEKNEFLDRNHLQGKDSSMLGVGLFDRNGVLVSVMTFCEPRKALNSSGKSGVVELSRFANLLDTVVVGGFSKLLANCLPMLRGRYSELISYANLRYSQGDVYEKNGFELIDVSDPSYWYFKENSTKLFHRYNFRKQVLEKKLESFDPNLSEYQNMRNNGYHRIWDCGNLKYSLKIE